MGSGNVRECELLNLQTQKPCSLDQFPNIGTTHCYTAAGTFKSSNAPEKIYTAFARGCINCTGFNSSRLPFLIFINSWFVQSLEFVKKAWNLSSNFPNLEKVCNIDISSGKIVCLFVFFFTATGSALRLNFFRWSNLFQSRSYVCSALWMLCSCVFKVSIDHLFDNLESGKKIIVLEKKSGKSRILDPKTCAKPVNRTNS